MFFTQDDYRKIQEWLQRNSVKDTEFQEADIPLNGNEVITLVQNGHNKKVHLEDLVKQMFSIGVTDFVNVSSLHDKYNITLNEAIQLVPHKSRKKGQVITFCNTDNVWKIYQFTGVKNQWNILDLWNDLFDWTTILDVNFGPDEEDITANKSEDNIKLSFKDRVYEPDSHSGLGYKILRKNIITYNDPVQGELTKNILVQDKVAQSNTIYEIRYDFDLNNQTINIPENSVLQYKGGSLNNGKIVYNNTIIEGIERLNSVTTEGDYIYPYTGDVTNPDEQLAPTLAQLKKLSTEVTNIADDEDLTKVYDSEKGQEVLQLKDRQYVQGSNNGMGYVILRQNKSFKEQVTKANTIYEIRYDFDLRDEEVEIPENCVLKFEGGSLNNGTVILGAFNTLAGSTLTGSTHNDVYIILNKQCVLKDLILSYTAAKKSAITFELSRVVYDKYYSDTNIRVNNISIRNTNENNNIAAVSLMSDVDSENKDICGCFNISFSHVDIKGYYAIGFDVDGKYENSWFTQLSFNRCFMYGPRNGWSFNRTKGSCQFVTISDSGYQSFDDTTSGIFANKINHLEVVTTKFWDFSGHKLEYICDFDNNCSEVRLNSSGNSSSVKLYKIRDTGTSAKPTTIYVSEETSSNLRISKYLSEEEEVTLQDVVERVPNGTYYLSPERRDAYYNNWGVIVGDGLTQIGAVFSVYKTGVMIIIRCVSQMTVESSAPTVSSYQYIEGGLNFSNLGVKLKDLWQRINVPAALGDTQFSRILYPYVGQAFFHRGKNMPVVYQGNKWVYYDGFDISYKRNGSEEEKPTLSSADVGFTYYNKSLGVFEVWTGNAWRNTIGFSPSIRAGGTNNRPQTHSFDTGLFYFDTEVKAPIWWNGAKWVNANGYTAALNTGTSSNRPSVVDKGFQYFDTTLNKPIWWTGDKWVDATGAEV